MSNLVEIIIFCESKKNEQDSTYITLQTIDGPSDFCEKEVYFYGTSHYIRAKGEKNGEYWNTNYSYGVVVNESQVMTLDDFKQTIKNNNPIITETNTMSKEKVFIKGYYNPPYFCVKNEQAKDVNLQVDQNQLHRINEPGTQYAIEVSAKKAIAYNKEYYQIDYINLYFHTSLDQIVDPSKIISKLDDFNHGEYPPNEYGQTVMKLEKKLEDIWVLGYYNNGIFTLHNNKDIKIGHIYWKDLDVYTVNITDEERIATKMKGYSEGKKWIIVDESGDTKVDCHTVVSPNCIGEKIQDYKDVWVIGKYEEPNFIVDSVFGTKSFEINKDDVISLSRKVFKTKMKGRYIDHIKEWKILYNKIKFYVPEYLVRIEENKAPVENVKIVVFGDKKETENGTFLVVSTGYSFISIPVNLITQGVNYKYINAEGHRIDDLWLVNYKDQEYSIHKDNVMTLEDFQKEQSVELQDVWVYGKYDLNFDFVVKSPDGNKRLKISKNDIMEYLDNNCIRVKMKGRYIPSYKEWEVSLGIYCFKVKETEVLDFRKITESHNFNIEEWTQKSLETMVKESGLIENKVFESGAQRSKDVDEYRYDLFHPIFMKRVAKVWAQGAKKYGEHNWEQGFPMPEIFNHLLAHCFEYLSGDRSEDHLSHMACNIVMLIVEEDMRYDQNKKYLRDTGCKLSKEMLQEIEKFRVDKQYEDPNYESVAQIILKLYQGKKIAYKEGAKYKFLIFAYQFFSSLIVDFPTLYKEMLNIGFTFENYNDETLEHTYILNIEVNNEKIEQSVAMVLSELYLNKKLQYKEGTNYLYHSFAAKYFPRTNLDYLYQEMIKSGFKFTNDNNNLYILNLIEVHNAN